MYEPTVPGGPSFYYQPPVPDFDVTPDDYAWPPQKPQEFPADIVVEPFDTVPFEVPVPEPPPFLPVFPLMDQGWIDFLSTQVQLPNLVIGGDNSVYMAELVRLRDEYERTKKESHHDGSREGTEEGPQAEAAGQGEPEEGAGAAGPAAGQGEGGA